MLERSFLFVLPLRSRMHSPVTDTLASTKREYGISSAAESTTGTYTTSPSSSAITKNAKRRSVPSRNTSTTDPSNVTTRSQLSGLLRSFTATATGGGASPFEITVTMSASAMLYPFVMSLQSMRPDILTLSPRETAVFVPSCASDTKIAPVASDTAKPSLSSSSPCVTIASSSKASSRGRESYTAPLTAPASRSTPPPAAVDRTAAANAMKILCVSMPSIVP